MIEEAPLRGFEEIQKSRSNRPEGRAERPFPAGKTADLFVKGLDLARPGIHSVRGRNFSNYSIEKSFVLVNFISLSAPPACLRLRCI